MTHLRADEWEVRSVPTHGEVLRAVRAWHYAGGAPNTSTYRHGMYPAGELLAGDSYGVALWLPPTPQCAISLAERFDRDPGSVLSLSLALLSIRCSRRTLPASCSVGR